MLRKLIQSSLAQIGSLLDLVDALGQHVTSFSAAMEQVRRSAQDIDDIAETTNILALNATIEAMRAGDAGRVLRALRFLARVWAESLGVLGLEA